MDAERADARARLTGALVATLVLAVSLLAIALGTTIAVRSAPVLDGASSYGRVLAWQLAVWLPWIPGAILVFWLATRVRLASLPTTTWVGAHLAGAAMMAAAHAGWYVAVSMEISPFRGLDGTKYGAYQYFFIYWFFCDLLIYWAVLGFSYARDYRHRVMVRERQALQLEAQLAEAQLTALRLQVRPHLLFNVLNTVVSMLRSGEREKALKMVLALSELLRQLLTQHDRQEIPLRQELKLADAYLALERRRFEDRLTVELQVDDDTLDCLVPTLILQPIVENTIRHGVARSTQPCGLTLRATREHDRLLVELRDTGTHATLRDDEPSGLGIGLRNTRARLQELYGSEQSFSIARNAAGGVTVMIAMPIRRAEATPTPLPAA